MPVGKNSLKRVTNNGYSKVEAKAPDMENSEIVTPVEPKEEVKAEVKTVEAKTAPKKNTAPKTKKPATPKPKVEKAEPTRPNGFARFGLGQDLPVHLL